MAIFEVVCEDCDTVIAEADSINDVIDLARRNGGHQRDPFWDQSGEWFCDSCAEAGYERRYSGDPAPTGNDPLTDYLAIKEPWNRR